MPGPNVNFRTRNVGWVNGVVMGNAGALEHGPRGNLTPGFPQDSFPFQVNHAILGGASSLFRDQIPLNQLLYPSTEIPGVRDSYCTYLEIQCHLRSEANVDLPGRVRIFMNELPSANVATLGDWVLNGWQEWEEFSPITIPTPPPGFWSGGANGIRYEYRRRLGTVPSAIFYVEFSNLGTVPATEWALITMLRSDPPVFGR